MYTALKQSGEHSTCWKWMRLGIVWFCCCLAAGIIPGQALFAHMFAEAGVYGQQCEHQIPCDAQLAILNMMLGLGQTLVLLAMLPVGLLFDYYGGRTLGAVGSCLVGFGLLLMTITLYSALNGTDSQSNWLLPIAALITDFGSIMNSYCFFSLVWHYPGSTTMILSLSTSTYQVSALLPMFLQQLMGATGMRLDLAMLVFAALVLASVHTIWRVTPSQQEFYDRAQDVLGVPLPKPKRSFEPFSRLKKGWAAVRMDLRDHLWLMLGQACAIGFASTYNSMSSAYGEHLFGNKAAGEELAQVQVVATALVGALCAPSVARLADCLGLQRFAWVLVSFVLYSTALFFVPAWWAAWVTSTGLVLYTSLSSLFANRYFLHYAPPNRVGAYSGVFTILYVVISMPFTIGSYGWMMAEPEAERFFVPYLVLGCLSVFSLVAFNIRFCIVHDGRGVPKFPKMLPEDEMELVAIFGAMTIEEAAEIVGLDAEVLFKRLADPDPENLKQLVCMISTEKVEAKLAERSPEDMIRMFELQADAEQGYEEEDVGTYPVTTSQREDGFTPVSTSEGDADTKLLAGGAPEANLEPHEAATAKDLAQEWCRSFRETDASSRKAMLDRVAQKGDDEMRWRALGECLDVLVCERATEACKLFLLEVPIEDQWKAMIGMEDWMDEKYAKEWDKQFNKTVPAKVFAGLLRQRPALKDLVARLVKREVQRSVNRYRGKKKPKQVSP